MRVAIVNDMALAVEALRRVVMSAPAYEIAWIAHDGEEAVRLCAADVPDVILMDLMMPRMDGAEATRQIMHASPCAILVVTATVDGHAPKVFEAMGHGALDAVNTPVLGPSGEPSGGAALLAKIAMIGTLIGKPAARAASPPRDPIRRADRAGVPLVVIGASTGGPAALARVLAALPADLPAAIAIVQHIDEQFADGLASWLSTESGRDVRTIKAGDSIDAGAIRIAATNEHLIVAPDLRFDYVKEPAELAYRPSVDVFFRSAAASWPGPLIGVLLTGMGSDGAQGMLAVRRAGWHTIAQDEASCVVYGMPKAAVKIDAVAELVSLDTIPEAIVRAMTRVSLLTRGTRT